MGMVLMGPAEPLGPVLEGPAEPVNAVLRGLTEPLELLSDSEHFVDLYGTRASADAVLDFTEEARVLASTDPHPLYAQRTELSWVGSLKKPKSMAFDTPQISSLS